MPFDTTSDTTQNATRRNVWQPPAKKSAYLSRFCNLQQRQETHVGGLWLRRSRVRVPSVTLSFAGETPLLLDCADIRGSLMTCRLVSLALAFRDHQYITVVGDAGKEHTLLRKFCS